MNPLARMLCPVVFGSFVVALAQAPVPSVGQRGPAANKGGAKSPQARPGVPRVAFGEFRRGTIERRGGRQRFQLSASTGDVVFAQAQRCNIQGGSPVTMKPTIEIRDPSGSVLVNATEDNTQNFVSVRGLRLESDGLYTVEVSDLGDLAQYTGGPFALFVQRLNGPAKAKSLKPGIDQTAFLNTCGQLDTYAFDAQRGDRIQLSIGQVSVGGLYPRIELYDPDGSFLGDARSYDVSGTRLSPPGVVRAAASKSGAYTAIVMNLYGAGTGAYRIGVEITQ